VTGLPFHRWSPVQVYRTTWQRTAESRTRELLVTKSHALTITLPSHRAMGLPRPCWTIS